MLKESVCSVCLPEGVMSYSRVLQPGIGFELKNVKCLYEVWNRGIIRIRWKLGGSGNFRAAFAFFAYASNSPRTILVIK